MDRFDAMRLFTRIVDRRSFTLAADDLGLPRSTVTGAVKQLERRLGVQLLRRTTRHVAPTLDGQAYYHRCLSILADLDDAEGAFAGARPKGVVRADVHGTLARAFILPHLPRFLDLYPDITLHMTEGDRLVDVVREGVDCVVRAGSPHDDQMVVRLLAHLECATLASPAYLSRHGCPNRLDDLAGQHCMVGFSSASGAGLWPLEFVIDGMTRTITLPAALTVNGAESYVAAAGMGLGVIQVPRYHVADAMAAGQLVELFPQTPPPPMGVWLMYPPNRQLSPRVRVFMDWLAECFMPATL